MASRKKCHTARMGAFGQSRIRAQRGRRSRLPALACERDETLGGIGFVFSAEDPYVGIDLDHCVENGELAPWALEIVRDLWSYCEWSRSGDGLHIIVRGKLAARGNKRAVQGATRADAAIEMHDHGRYFVMTSNRYGDGFTTIEELCTAEKHWKS